MFGTTSVDNWIKFANVLKLKILMRESNINNVQSELAELIQADNFPAEDVSWADFWTDESGSASPFYQEEYASYFGYYSINLIANLTFMQTMTDSNDPRREKFFEVNDNGDYTGGLSGINFLYQRFIYPSIFVVLYFYITCMYI